MNVGSLFSGYGGLDLAVEAVFGAETAWFSEIEDAPSKILAHHWPDVPNLGDITKIEWDEVEHVDILGGGFPCQDVSLAGKRAGLTPDSRSGLWSHFALGISKLRPQYVVIENVRGLLSATADSDVEPCPWCLGDGPGEPALRALGAVLGDLAELGYDTQWCGLRAADIGGPHGRYRIFVLAVDTKCVGSGSLRTNGSEPLQADGSRRAGEPLGDTADRGRDDARLEIGRGESAWSTGGSGVAVADAECERHEQAFGATSGETARSGPFHPVDGRRRACVAADTSRTRLQVADSVAGGLSATQPAADRATADTQGDRRHEGQPEPARLIGRPDAAQRGDALANSERWGCETTAADPGGALRTGTPKEGGQPESGWPASDSGSSGSVDWGQYGPAVERWERVLGRVAPAPTEPNSKGSHRLNPAFVEWMMGLPAGWVTDVPVISRNEQLRMLGNGVVPQQAAAALQMLLAATLVPTSTAGAA